MSEFNVVLEGEYKGKKIKRGNQEQLEDGAVIRFAKKEYEFLIQDI